MADRRALTFWLSSLTAAAAFAALVPLLLPYGKLGLVTEADRERAWLLTVFCAGALAVLLGATGLLSAPRWLTLRDVEEAGSVAEARVRAQAARRGIGGGEGGWARNPGWWTVATGCFLIAIYFVLWRALG